MARPHTRIRSKKQFRAMAAARAAQEGRISKSSLYGAAKEMAESMVTSGPKSPKAHMEEVAGKKYKRLPKSVSARRARLRRKKKK